MKKIYDVLEYGWTMDEEVRNLSGGCQDSCTPDDSKLLFYSHEVLHFTSIYPLLVMRLEFRWCFSVTSPSNLDLGLKSTVGE